RATTARSGASSPAQVAADASSRSRKIAKPPNAFSTPGAPITKKTASSPSSAHRGLADALRRATHSRHRKIMARTSRLPGFYKISVDERRALVSDTTGAGPDEVANALEQGGLDAETADKFVE